MNKSTRRTNLVLGRLFAAILLSAPALSSGCTQVMPGGTATQPPSADQNRTADMSLPERANAKFFKLVDSLGLKSKPKFSGDGSGNLDLVDPDGRVVGSCPLRNTAVSVHITGHIASVDVKQSFRNSYRQIVNARYTFPLSASAAVDDMVMKVGDRTIHGTIKRREEAHQIYQQAMAQGYVASLLDQERPNIFTQSVANLEPGKDVEVTVHYVDILPFESGSYTFAFPTVVGPRFASGRTHDAERALAQGNGTTVSGASRSTALIYGTTYGSSTGSSLNPVYAEKSGHDLSISMDIDAGVAVSEVACPLHKVLINPLSSSHAHIDLANQHERPNRDFVFSWKVADKRINSTYFAERRGTSGYLSMMLIPPARVTPETAAPKEMIFVVDRSGSQSGQPIEKAKETMDYILDHMNPNDTFQVVSFSNGVETLFPKPEVATAAMKANAHQYIRNIQANGGTQMAEAINAINAMPAQNNRLRIITLMTDGYVDNDMEILSRVKQGRGKARWFSFGTGNSVNRFLIDKVASVGGGEADYVLLNSPGAEVAEKFYERISSPVLTDVKVSAQGLELDDIFPRNPADVWAERPLYIQARYTKPGSGFVTLKGFAGGKPYNQTLKVVLPEKTNENNHIAQLWARSAVDELMNLDWMEAQVMDPDHALNKAITELGLRYHIMTEFTSFVAVDESFKTTGSQALSIQVPEEIPDGVNLHEIFLTAEKSVISAPYAVSGTKTWTSPQPVASSANQVQNSSPTFIDWGAALIYGQVRYGGFCGLANWLMASCRDANLFEGGCDTAYSGMPLSFNFPSAGKNVPAGAPLQLANPAPVYQQPVPASGGGASFGDMYSSQPSVNTSITPSYGSDGNVFASQGVTGTSGSTYPKAQAPVLQGATNGTLGPNPALGGTSGTSYTNAQSPVLQGATSGTIGPQGGDATVVMGVNTAGTVRVNNLANLEALLNIVCNALDLSALLFGLTQLIMGLAGCIKRRAGAGKQVGFALLWFAVWSFFCLALIPWAGFLITRKLIRARRMRSINALKSAELTAI